MVLDVEAEVVFLGSDRGDRGTGAQVDAVLPVQLLEVGRDDGTGHPREHAGGGFEDGDAEAALPQGRGDFEADETGADDGCVSGLGEGLAEAVGVGGGPEGEDAGVLDSGDGGSAVRRAGGEHQRVVGQAVVADVDGLVFAIDQVDRFAQPQGDAVLLVERLGTDPAWRGRRVGPGSLEVGLGQRRPVVERPRLVADDGDIAELMVRTEAVAELGGGVACADDHQPVAGIGGVQGATTRTRWPSSSGRSGT